MITIIIDGQKVAAQSGTSILTAAKEHGIHIPSLCGDGRVPPRGSCGLCVVEADGGPALYLACCTEASEGMVIRTRSPRIDAVRKALLELTLSVHTGDCRPDCQLECPAHADCQGFISLIGKGHFRRSERGRSLCALAV